MKKFVLAGALALLLTGCGKEFLRNLTTSASEDNQVHEIDLHPPQLTCSTGRHTFRGLTAYCDGLQNETLNQGCGQAVRRGFFVSVGCPGTFKPYFPAARP